MNLRAPIALAACLLLSGCAWVPSGLRFGGSPLDRVEKKEDAEQAAREKLLKKGQEAAHKAASALSEPAGERRDEIAKDYTRETVQAFDQALGTPLAGDQTKWGLLVKGLVSEDPAIRARAEADRAADRAQLAKVSAQLASKEAAVEAAEKKAMDYARETERIADMLRKFVWAVGGLAALWLLSQVLTIAARLNPAFAGAAAVANTIAAPAVQFAARRAQDGLSRVGQAITTLQEKAPDAVERVVQILDQHTDADHQAAIAKARKKP